MIGIYRIFNTLNNHCYIGSSKDIEYRVKRHFMFLSNNNHINPHLQNAYNKYGLESFKYEVICNCTEGELLLKEQEFMDNTLPEYNINLIAAKPPSPKGRKQSAESIEKRASKRRGVPRPEYIKEKLRKPKTIKVTSQHKYVAVVQIDKATGLELKTFKSVVQAATYLDPKTFVKKKSGISRCIRGRNQTAYGYKWRYATI